jgi:hypothetical protein
MVVRCDSAVPGIGELRSQVGEVGDGDRSGVQPVQVATRKVGGDYRYSGTVITVYIGNKMVYAGDSVDNAVDRICSPGGIDYELWAV